MRLYIKVFIALVFISTILFAQTKETSVVQKNEVDVLLEKVTQAQKKEDKQLLIEDLKRKLAKKNRQAQEESDAIMKAKQKTPIKIYRPSSE